jgi:MtrB/PioB family decaheme-associated outer membrane protein
MIIRKALSAIALATTCLTPLVAFADDAAPTTYTHGDIQVDVGGVIGNNANQFGRYNGLNSGGVFGGVGEFNVTNAAPWDSGDAHFFMMNGRDLIFQSSGHLGTGISSSSAWASDTHNSLANAGSLGFRVGEQGVWEVGFNYEAITYTGNVIDSLYTVNGGLATLNHGLAPWGGATTTRAGVTTFTIAGLAATGAMQPVQTGTRRDIFAGNFKYLWGDWTFTGAIRHEHKEGSLEESFDGPYGGTAFGLPVNYDTDRYDMTAAYTTRHLQGMVQYSFSHFTDNVNFVNLPYPTSNTAAPFQRSAAYSTPPSNDAHYLTFMGATDVIPYTHINANARIGLELQDNQFAPNTADPTVPSSAMGFGLLNSNLQGTSANSPEMAAEIYQLKLSAASHPLPNVDTRIYYGLDGRDVSLNQYKVNVGGTGGSSDSALTGTAFVVPQDWFKQNAGIEGGYRFLPEYNSKVTLGYRYDAIDRSNAQVGHSSKSTASIILSSDFGPQVNSKLSFEYADRTGSMTYLGPWTYLAQGPAYSGAYYQAPMTSESVTFRTDYLPLDNLTTELFLQFKNENYNYAAATVANGGTTATLPLTGSGQGIKQDYALSVGPDINYRPSPTTNVHFFYTYELLFYNNTGNGACSELSQLAAVPAVCTGSAGYFQNKQTSGTHTVGLAGEWQVNEKLKLKAEYTFSYGSVMFGEFNGVFVSNPTLSNQNVGNYPDINSLMNNIRLTATYDVMPNITLVLQGLFTSFHNNDWNDTANAAQGAGTTAVSILTPGYASPNYTVAALVAGVKLRF